MMPSWFQILIVVLLAVLLFGRGKISSLMGDVAKGINAFKRGMKDGAEEEAAEKKLQDESVIDVSSSSSKTESKT
ncbi:MAG: twin-arginine translocase TatA/TatE family subunit [Pseudomonadota bacterium]